VAIEAGLKDQVADFERKDRIMKGARRDLEDKMRELEDTHRKRKEEADELRRILQDKGRAGDQLQN